MMTVYLRFYEELNDFIRYPYRKTQIEKNLKHRTTVKDVIESYGVPHTEVDLILVNGKSVPFGYHLNDRDNISVYPVFESFDITGITRLQERPLRNLRFVADVHLGKLVSKLRILGIDVIYRNDSSDKELLEAVVNKHRVLLTRDRRLLMHNVVKRGYLVRSDNPVQQILEVIRRFDLADNLSPFARCVECNFRLNPVSKDDVIDRLEPKTRIYYHEFVQCEGCQKIYWRGSHFEQLKNFVDRIRKESVNKS